MDLRKKMAIGLSISALVLLGAVGTYAFYIRADANNVKQEMQIKTGKMTLTFTDDNNAINKNLQFGETIDKVFEIKNTGTIDAPVKLVWENLVNTYLSESLTYKLEVSNSENGPFSPMATPSENVPRSDVASRKDLSSEINVPANTTYYYKLSITLEYLDDVDQTQDIEASLSTKFNLIDLSNV